MSDKDWDKMAAFEKAISKKYGAKTIQNPKSNWNEEKEKDYMEQQRELFEKEILRNENYEKIEVDGVLFSKKLLSRDSKSPCPECDKLFFKATDDVCMTKYQCCFQCYIKWVQGREERWMGGWRPDATYQETD